MSSNLSLDIQVEIMKRLPARSLIQFRSVCKEWKSLIDSSDFIAGYEARHVQSEHLLVSYEVGYDEEIEVNRVSFVDDDDTFPQQKFALTVDRSLQVIVTVGSSCGLFCSTGFLRKATDSSEDQMAVIWNPAIRKSIAVAVPAPYMVPEVFYSTVAFGVRPDTMDPKLVKITYIDDSKKMESISCIPNQVMVFTLSLREWKCLCSDHLPRKSIQFPFSDQTVLGRFIYWVVHDWIAFGDQFRSYNLIMSFDLITNEFRELHLPSSLANIRGSNLSISSLRESLVLIEYDYMVEPGTDNRKRVCTVWMMEHGDSKAFTKLFTINLPNASVYWFQGFRKNGEPIVIKEDFDRSHAIVVYEPCWKHIKELGIRGRERSLFVSSVFASSYTESLLLLDHDDGHIVNCGGPVKR